jgi:RNA polymerase sigma factor (TIGR02999 family)
VEYARSHGRQKRGGGEIPIPLDEAVLVGPEASSTVLDLDEALQRLSALDERKSDIIQLLFFGGLTYDETAAALNISPATVHRELKLAKAWLHRELSQSEA